MLSQLPLPYSWTTTAWYTHPLHGLVIFLLIIHLLTFFLVYPHHFSVLYFSYPLCYQQFMNTTVSSVLGGSWKVEKVLYIKKKDDFHTRKNKFLLNGWWGCISAGIAWGSCVSPSETCSNESKDVFKMCHWEVMTVSSETKPTWVRFSISHPSIWEIWLHCYPMLWEI